MKRQFYLDDVERDLLICAIELWKHRLDKSVENVSSSGHWYAARFTERRLAAMKARLEAPEKKEEA